MKLKGKIKKARRGKRKVEIRKGRNRKIQQRMARQGKRKQERKA